MVIYRDTRFVIEQKINSVFYSSYKKRNKREGRRFCKDYGDIPQGNINEITGQFEPCVNTRGQAYALRNAKRYRKTRTL